MIEILLGVMVVSFMLHTIPSAIVDAANALRASKAGEWDYLDKQADRKDARAASRKEAFGKAWSGVRAARNRRAGGDGTSRPGMSAYLGEVYHGLWEDQLEKRQAVRAARPPVGPDGKRPLAERVDEAVLARVQGQRRRSGRWERANMDDRPIADTAPVERPTVDGLWIACSDCGVSLRSVGGEWVHPSGDCVSAGARLPLKPSQVPPVNACPDCGDPLHDVDGKWTHPDGRGCPVTTPPQPAPVDAAAEPAEEKPAGSVNLFDAYTEHAGQNGPLTACATGCGLTYRRDRMYPRTVAGRDGWVCGGCRARLDAAYMWGCRRCGVERRGYSSLAAATQAGNEHVCKNVSPDDRPLTNQVVGVDEKAQQRWELFGMCCWRVRPPEGFEDWWCENPATDGPYCDEHKQQIKEGAMSSIPPQPPAAPTDRTEQADRPTEDAHRAFEQHAPSEGDAMSTATEVNTNEDARQAFTTMKAAAAEASDAIAMLEAAKAKMAAAANGTADGMSGKRFDSTATQAAVEAADAINLAELGNWSEKVDAVAEAAERGHAALAKWLDSEDMVAQHGVDASTLEPTR